MSQEIVVGGGKALRSILLRAAAVALGLLCIAGCASTLASAYVRAIHATSPIDWNGQTRIVLPLELDGSGRPGVKVQVNGHDAIALLDTGSPMPLIAAEMARVSGLRVESQGNGRGLAKDVSVQIGTGSIKLATAFIDERNHLMQLILGQEVFSQAVVELDFDARAVTLIHHKEFRPPAAASLPVRMSVSKPTVELKINDSGRTLCATVDTGFDSGIALSSRIVDELSLPAVAGRSAEYQGVGGNRTVVPVLAPLREVHIGGDTYRDVEVVGRLPNEELRCGGLVGMKILSQHRLVFDMKHSRIWLLPRSRVK
jgi:predicted aspartyl protease